MPWKIATQGSLNLPGDFTPFFFLFRPFMFALHRTFTNKVEPLGQAELVNESFEVILFTSFNGEHFRTVQFKLHGGGFFRFSSSWAWEMKGKTWSPCYLSCCHQSPSFCLTKEHVEKTWHSFLRKVDGGQAGEQKETGSFSFREKGHWWPSGNVICSHLFNCFENLALFVL